MLSAPAACLVPPPLEVAEEDNGAPELLREGLIPAEREPPPVAGDATMFIQLRVLDPDVDDELYFRLFRDGALVHEQGPLPNPGRRQSRPVREEEFRPCAPFDPAVPRRFVLAVVADRPFVEDAAGEQDAAGKQDEPAAVGPYDVVAPGVAVFNDWIVRCVAPPEGT